MLGRQRNKQLKTERAPDRRSVRGLFHEPTGAEMTWTLWGDGLDPMDEGLTEEEAREAVAEHEASGLHEVYAESEDGEVIE
jgi:hypothetical protein